MYSAYSSYFCLGVCLFVSLFLNVCIIIIIIMILLLFSFPFLVVLIYQVKGTVHPKNKIC